MYNLYKKILKQPSGGLSKIVIIKRLAIFILIVSRMQVSASEITQKITLFKTDASLIDVLTQIRSQSGYGFVLNSSFLKDAHLISIDVKNSELRSVLDQIFKNQPLTYSIDDKSVIIKKRNPSSIPLDKNNVKRFPKERQDSILYHGKVLDERGRPLPGATIFLRGGTKGSISAPNGDFQRYGTQKGIMVIKYVGYQNQEISLLGRKPNDEIVVRMVPGQEQLGEVNIVSTGYQTLDKTRITGSAEVITKQMLQHSNSPNLLSRLEGLSSTINFNNQLIPTNSANRTTRGISPLNNMTIRGKNTLLSSVLGSGGRELNYSGVPLVVIDGVPSPIPIESINPENVEQISILKDAAAASIWGARAANGVIVVTTKKGKYEQPLVVNFNSNFNVTEKMDLFYKKMMSVSDYIDVEQAIFPNKSIRTSSLIKPASAVSPVLELLKKVQEGKIDNATAQARIDALRENDYRRDYTKYFLRNAVSQNYSLGLSAGSKGFNYNLSAGYNKNINNTIGSDGNQITGSYSATLKPVKNLELGANINYFLQRSNNLNSAASIGQSLGSDSDTGIYPYSRLVDDQGNPVAVDRKYRPDFIKLLQDNYGSKVLALDYVPLNDINEGYVKTKVQNISLAVTANYRLSNLISTNFVYSYGSSENENNDLLRQNSWYLRNQINYYTARPGTTNQYGEDLSFKRGLPLGGIYHPSSLKSETQTLRGNLNINKVWNDRHEFTAIAGGELGQSYNNFRDDIYYGYDEKLLRSVQALPGFSANVPTLWNNDFGTPFGRLPGLGSGFRSIKTRTVSLFANSAYTYAKRYTISASIRNDASSDFGVGTNKWRSPFYSAGFKWTINNESFYKWDLVPSLALRATFGYNGNNNPLVYSTDFITYRGATVDPWTGLPYAERSGDNVSNSLLRPEKTAVLNLGIDFSFRNNRISGSLEYYKKNTTDLISSSPVDPATGFSIVNYNTASLKAYGVDLTLNSVNLRSRKFSWTSNFLMSTSRVKVIEVFATRPDIVNQFVEGYPNYNKGYDLTRLFAYTWAGLDPANGFPRGVLNNGQVVTIDNTSVGRDNFNMLATASSPGGNSPSLKFMGSGVPLLQGSLRNTFSYGNFSVSANILYKFGYYFRRSISDVVQYNPLLTTGVMQSADYRNRWKQPGDEVFTSVPAMPSTPGVDMDQFYYFSEINVLKGDHIRLQEVNPSYSFGGKNWGPLKNPRIYANLPMSDVIIWRANKAGVDPEAYDFPRQKTYSIGFSASF